MIWVNCMGVNSIRNNLSKQSIISEIRLCKSADLSHHLTYVIVEGIDDVQFFRKNLSHEVNLFESFSGKKGVLEIVDFFTSDDVIGICDRDYDMGDPPQRIFYYDHSSLEAMLLSSSDTFVEVCGTLYTQISEQCLLQIYHDMFIELRWLSALRKLNSRNALGINFRGVSIFSVFDEASEKIVKGNLVNRIKSMNAAIFRANPQLIADADVEAQQINCLADDLNYLNGHDILQLIHCFLKVHSSGRDYNENEILVSLILGYDFRQSILYHSLVQYQGSAQVNLVI